MILVIRTSLASLSSQNLTEAKILSKVNNSVMVTSTMKAATNSLNATSEKCGKGLPEGRKTVKYNELTI
jgi:hypothetical protein